MENEQDIYKYSIYTNPLADRYATPEMSEIFSDNVKYKTWRKLWFALASSQKELGLNISQRQLDQMQNNLDLIDYKKVNDYEKKTRHDVMAHIHGFADVAPDAKPIIHLGATSCFVTDNADLILMYEALLVIRKRVLNIIENLANFAYKYKNIPTLGLTHLQSAQLTTVGKRATLWIYDLVSDLESIDFIIDNYRLRGLKGTTGTQATFLQLFDGDHEKVKELEKKVIEKMGFSNSIFVTGQTYSRKIDYNITSVLSQIAQSAYKFSNDMRLLQSRKELEEPFEKNQVGSSAMAYKRNPMRSERMSSLARFVINIPSSLAVSSSTQWFERTLDDSALKRISIPEAFLALDGVLNLYSNIVENIVVYEKVIEKYVKDELPFMATEVILMESVKLGGDRQILHEKIRFHSMKSTEVVKIHGKSNDLIERIKNDEEFSNIHEKIDTLMDPQNFIGRADKQTEEFIQEIVNPLLKKNKSLLGVTAVIQV